MLAVGLCYGCVSQPVGPAMPNPRLLPIILAALACLVGGVASVTAETLPEPVTIPPGGANETATPAIEFYLARGEADACGPGCNEWIAAAGKIDGNAVLRLRTLLTKLGGRRPPIYFHSPGGSVVGSIELGRFIRAQKLTVSVAHTMPLHCDGEKAGEKACEAEKRSGVAIDAEFDPTSYMCNSACVYALAGGTVRLIAPWVKLGIHDVRVDPAINLQHTAAVDRLVKLTVYDRLRGYLREMGIDNALLTAAAATPFESIRLLQRDELVRFGIDRREFDETAWQFVGKPAPAITKRFFVRTDGDQPAYVDGLMNVDCGIGAAMRLVFARQHFASDPYFSGVPAASIGISVSGKEIGLFRAASPKFYLRAALLALNAFDAVGENATIKLPGTELGRGEGADVTLNMKGFSTAYAKLLKACPNARPNAQAAITAVPGAQTISPFMVFPSRSGPAPFAAAPSPAGTATASVFPDPSTVPDAAPIVESRDVFTGSEARIAAMNYLNADCSSGPVPVVRVATPPANGDVRLEKTTVSANHRATAALSHCNGKPVDAMGVFYTSKGEFTGVDTIILDVDFRHGAIVRYIFKINVR
jgi:hypothetical protein